MPERLYASNDNIRQRHTRVEIATIVQFEARYTACGFRNACHVLTNCDGQRGVAVCMVEPRTQRSHHANWDAGYTHVIFDIAFVLGGLR